MCCSRRNNRAPVMVTLGKMAYDKYQERKAEKQAIAYSSSPDRSSLSDMANGEILEKAGIAPPSYDEVVVSQRAITPEEREPPMDSKHGWTAYSDEKQATHYDSDDDEVFHEAEQWLSRRSKRGVQGSREDEALSAEAAEWLKERLARSTVAGSSNMAAVPQQEDWRARWQRQKAERAIRRAERRARGGCCC